MAIYWDSDEPVGHERRRRLRILLGKEEAPPTWWQRIVNSIFGRRESWTQLHVNR